MIRRAAVAGRFYPDSASELKQVLSACIPSPERQYAVKGMLVPHAGYSFSGAVAGMTYAAVRLPRRFILLCPNHVGVGAPISIASEGEWETPLGRARVDTELADALRQETLLVQENLSAHRNEHALEVHLPFLQYLLGDQFSFVPISVGTRRYESLLELGDALAATVRNSGEEVMLIASSDMNHFEPATLTEQKDRQAIAAIEQLDCRALQERVESQQISMCGYAPAMAVMRAARELGATRGELIRYTHSGKVNGDESSVVGYAGLILR